MWKNYRAAVFSASVYLRGPLVVSDDAKGSRRLSEPVGGPLLPRAIHLATEAPAGASAGQSAGRINLFLCKLEAAEHPPVGSLHPAASHYAQADSLWLALVVRTIWRLLGVNQRVSALDSGSASHFGGRQ